EARDAMNHLFGRFRIGASTGDEDVLWGSTRGRATRFRPRRSSPDCHTDPRTDHWTALCDVKERVAMVGVFDGPVVRVGTWIRPEFYQLECWTPAHFTLAPEATMTTTWRLAPCFNMGGVAFANEDLAVGIVPEAEVLSAGAKEWRTRVSAVSFRKGPAGVMLKARFVDRHGRVVKELPGVTVACRFLVAEPQLVPFSVADLPAGDYDMHVTLESGGRQVGETTLALRRADAGPVLEIFRPADAEKGKAFPVLGTVERGRVQVTSVTVPDPMTIRVAGNQRTPTGQGSPFTAEIRLNDEGDGFEIRHTLTVKPGADDERVRAAGLALPLVLGNDWYKLKTTVGGEKLNDAWRFDQEDESVYTPTVSDYFSRWPLWKLGGVLQDSPSHYRIWKASDWDVAPMTTLEGTAAPGWVEVNNRRHGVRIEMSDMSSKAPREILVDGETGTALVWFYPPHVPPILLASSGDPAAPSLAERLKWLPGKPWTNTVSVRFQSGPHTFGFKRDVSDAAFRAALEALGDPGVPRSMSAIPLPTGTLEQCIQDLLDADVTLHDYLRRALGGGYRLRGLCQKLGVRQSKSDKETIDALIEMLKEKYP
ncbi:MAG TPA: hypothetical protein VMY39_00200, partial [Planctomycetota bacterium]|nr:hypothetical protein [Planctomycetota bacterium]